MSAVFKYNKEKGCLEEKNDMAIPLAANYAWEQDFNEAWKLYGAHEAKLRSYPTPFKEWGEGELIEGRDFKVIPVNPQPSNINIIAVPISSSQPKEESDDSIEAINEYAKAEYSIHDEVQKFWDWLRERYRINRKE